MIVSFFPIRWFGAEPGISELETNGDLVQGLTSGRRDASPGTQTKSGVADDFGEYSACKDENPWGFCAAGHSVCGDRVGIGGWQPHPAAEVFNHHYGDCKDKATLMGAMLHEIGIDSYYVVINSERGSVTPDTPAHMGGFDHAIIAIKLPEGATDSSWLPP